MKFVKMIIEKDGVRFELQFKVNKAGEAELIVDGERVIGFDVSNDKNRAYPVVIYEYPRISWISPTITCTADSTMGDTTLSYLAASQT